VVVHSLLNEHVEHGLRWVVDRGGGVNLSIWVVEGAKSVLGGWVSGGSSLLVSAFWFGFLGFCFDPWVGGSLGPLFVLSSCAVLLQSGRASS
jgi:hypothetical protein